MCIAGGGFDAIRHRVQLGLTARSGSHSRMILWRCQPLGCVSRPDRVQLGLTARSGSAFVEHMWTLIDVYQCALPVVDLMPFAWSVPQVVAL